MGKRSSTTPPGDDPTRPVTLARAAVAVNALGLRCLYGEDRVVLPWRDHILVLRRLIPSHPSLPATLRFDMVLRQRAKLDDSARLATVLNEWNRERLGPTATMAMHGDLTDSFIQLNGHSATVIDLGLSDEQLATAIELGVETSVLLTRELIDEFPSLYTGDNELADIIRDQQDDDAVRGTFAGLPPVTDSAMRSPSTTGEASSSSQHPSVADSPRTSSAIRDSFYNDGTGASPKEVVIDHIRAALTAAGIAKQQVVDDLVLAWINGVLFAFYIDNGPSLLVRGFWEAEAHPEHDALRLFLVCNDFNTQSDVNKAFTQHDRDGLQVRAEFTVALEAGQNAAQLKHLVNIALGQVMAAVHRISVDATGATAVEWPDSGGPAD